MTGLDELERATLAAARRGLMPELATRVRLREKALAAIATGAAVPVLAASAVERWSARARDGVEALCDGATATRLLVSALVFAGVGVGGYVLGVRHGRLEAAASAPVTLRLAEPTSAMPRARTVSPAPVADRSLPNPRSSGRPPYLLAPSAARPSESKPPADPEQELRTLRRVERAQREGNPRFALALLDELDRTSPRGKLGEERHAARTIALCTLDDAQSTAQARAAEFAARHSRSVYLPRVRQACAVADGAAERIGPAAETLSKERKGSP